MAPRVNKEDLTNKARFIFQGVVTRAFRPNKDKAEEASVLVKVDSVLRAPDVLAHITGSNVMMFLAAGEKVAEGERAVFYTNPVTWGDSISVRSLGHASPTPEAAGRLMMATPAKPLRDQRLEEQVQAADLVLTGTVSAVRLPRDEAPTSVRMNATAKTEVSPGLRPISEHDPLWREAVIDVHDVHKGNAKKQVVIRFPSSTDVRWHKAPKFRPGQQGIWLLHKKDMAPQVRARALEATVAAEDDQAYMALQPADFQPLEQVENIKTLIKASKPNK